MKTWIPLVLSLACVLSVRLFFYHGLSKETWKQDVYDGADGTSYIWQAIQYRNHGLFAYGEPKSKWYGAYDLIGGGSGYEMFLSWVMGEMPETEEDLEWHQYRRIVMAQMIVAVLIAGVLFLIVRGLTGGVAAFVVTIFYALALPSATMPFFVFGETYFTLLFLLGVVALIFAPKHRWLYFASGLVLGLAAYTRTMALYSWAPVGLIIWMQGRDDE